MAPRHRVQFYEDEATGAARDPQMRAFGEMVELLWAEGKPDAALRLEELWNDLARSQPLSLLCAYSLSHFASETDRQSFEEVCARHAKVIPAEGYPIGGETAEQLRVIAVLQQRAGALEAEIARRNVVEAALLRSETQFREQLADLATLHHVSTGVVGHQDLSTLLRTALQAASAGGAPARGTGGRCAARRQRTKG